MERTNRPIQVETRAPAGRQPRGVGQTGQKSDGQWADGLAREYDHKMAGRSTAAYEDGQEETEPEGEPMRSGGLGMERGRGGFSGENAEGQTEGRTLPESGGQTGGRDSVNGQAYGNSTGNQARGQAYGGSGYGQEKQSLGSSGGRWTGSAFQRLNDRQGQIARKEPEGGYRSRQTGSGMGGQEGRPPGNGISRPPVPVSENGMSRQPAGMPGSGAGRQPDRMPENGGGRLPAPMSENGMSRQPAGMPGNGMGRQPDGSSGSRALKNDGTSERSAGFPAGRQPENSARHQNGREAGKNAGHQARRLSGKSTGQFDDRTERNKRRTQNSSTAGNDARRRTDGGPNADRGKEGRRKIKSSKRPPGASSKRKGLLGGKKGKPAGARGREDIGRVYEDSLNASGSVQRRSTGPQVHPAAGQRAKPPGYGSNARRRPGGGINFLVQGSILAAAGIIVRLIGMVYRIPLAKKIGDVGNGYYNAAYSIYSILLIMSSYSLPTAMSKMVSARLAKGQYRTSTKIFRAGMFYATVAGMAGFCALWFGADYFANEIIKMPYSSYALKCLAPTIWIMAYLGVLRGYFQGHSTMIPTAVSQVFEQVVNAAISIVAASVLFDMGVKSNLVFHDTELSYAFGAAGGAIGTGAGALTALILFLLLTVGYVPTMRKQAKRDRKAQAESYGAISRALFVTIVPIIISSAIYNISNVVDNSIFGHVMDGLGESGQTASQWGVYMGRYHMLFNIPVAIANSLSSSLIPSLSRAAAERKRKDILSKIGSAIRFSMIIAIPSAVGLTVLAEPVSNLLFSGMDNEMLIRMMAVGSSAVVFFSLSTVSNAILQGINRMQVPIINSAVSLGIHVGALYVMLKVFHMGIYSVVYANILFAGMVCILNAISIARYTRYRQEIIKTFLIPCAASAAMGGAAWGMYQLCIKAAGNTISTAAAILTAIPVYFVLLIKLKGVDSQELKSMPGGTRILGVARKMRLM